MNTYLNLASSTLLLFLVLMLTSLSTSLILRLLQDRLSHSQLASWLAENETAVTVSVWAAAALATYFLGPHLLMFMLAQAGE